MMGKRSSFERVEKDFYKTPPEAIWPLIPHLIPESTFIEPCAGDGRLAKFLISQGFVCTLQSDIDPQGPEILKLDATTLDPVPAKYIITNPPWSRPILHQMIRNFVSSAESVWLLFDADWMHTSQATQFLPLIRKIVSVGRVKWFEETDMMGKDNCCWYLFDSLPKDGIQFVGRQAGRLEVEMTAEELGL